MNGIDFNSINSREDGYKALALQVIVLAVRDYKNKTRSRGALMKHFFNTYRLDFYCDICGLDPDFIRSTLKLICKKTG